MLKAIGVSFNTFKRIKCIGILIIGQILKLKAVIYFQ